MTEINSYNTFIDTQIITLTYIVSAITLLLGQKSIDRKNNFNLK